MILSIQESVKNWIENNFKALIMTGAVLFIALILLLITNVLTKRIKKKKNKRSYTISKLLQSVFKYLILIITIFAILSIWGINVTAAIAGVGILGLVIGLGAQDLIKDLLAGMGIVFENQYEIDDIVEIKGFKGKVMEIGLRTTKLISATGEIKIIRNGEINEVSNFSRSYSLAVAHVDVAYEEDLNKVITLLDEALPALKESYPQIIEGPVVAGVCNLAESGVTVKITAKTNPEEHYAVERALLKFIKELFDNNSVEIPYSKVVVKVNKSDE